jgi:hypothetical protein
MMAAPDTEATRVVTFARPEGGHQAVLMIEAYWRMPQGLYRLTAQQGTRGNYERWAKTLKGRVRVGPDMLARKIWEIGKCVREGRTGPEVDLGVVDLLAPPVKMPPHPANAIASSSAKVLDVAGLSRREYRLRPFHHGSSVRALLGQWEEAGGSSHIELVAGAKEELILDMRRAAAGWADQWGSEQLVEVILDMAVFCDRRGDRDAARTFREIGCAPSEQERERQVVPFLQEYVLWRLGVTGP